MKPKVNFYVAWDKGISNPKISRNQTANYEGYAESIEEFIQMCKRMLNKRCKRIKRISS